jgi:hypothetical protein
MYDSQSCWSEHVVEKSVLVDSCFTPAHFPRCLLLPLWWALLFFPLLEATDFMLIALIFPATWIWARTMIIMHMINTIKRSSFNTEYRVLFVTLCIASCGTWDTWPVGQYLDALRSSLFDRNPLLDDTCYHEQDYLPYLLWQKTRNSHKDHNYHSWIQTQIRSMSRMTHHKKHKNSHYFNNLLL